MAGHLKTDWLWLCCCRQPTARFQISKALLSRDCHWYLVWQLESGLTGALWSQGTRGCMEQCNCIFTASDCSVALLID